MKKSIAIPITMIVAVVLCLGIVGTAYANETPLDIVVIGPYGNTCYFDEFGTRGTQMWQLTQCVTGWNAHIY